MFGYQNPYSVANRAVVSGSLIGVHRRTQGNARAAASAYSANSSGNAGSIRSVYAGPLPWWRSVTIGSMPQARSRPSRAAGSVKSRV
jgi:hypothetical protein